MFKPVEPEIPKMEEVETPKEPKVEDFICNYGPLAAFTGFFATSSFLVSMSYLNSPLDTHSLYEVHIGIGAFGNFVLGVVIPGFVALTLYTIFNSKFIKHCQDFKALPNFDQLMENSRMYRQDEYDRKVAEAREQYRQDMEEYRKKYAEYKEDLARYEAEEDYRASNGIESQEVENKRIEREVQGGLLVGLAALGAYHAKRDHDRKERWNEYDAKRDREFNEMVERIHQENEEQREWNKRKSEILRELNKR